MLCLISALPFVHHAMPVPQCRHNLAVSFVSCHPQPTAITQAADSIPFWKLLVYILLL